ncbi:acetoacetate decarboxylase family protein [Virgibacillus kekensis]|uniref:Acetoacetate decarboxylase family protein n=1 Tax=Virgibacillus kekensis TaxID=202261 RepID=A0ABV9DGE3_9BACI
MNSNTGYNVPVHAPLFPDPFVPYTCKNYVSLFVIAEVRKDELKRILSFTPFEYVDNQMVISVSDFSNTDKVSYMDCAMVIPVKYKDKYGGYYIYEYENKDAAIAAGRDLWGYPKKYAEITLNQSNGEYRGIARKDGKVIVDIKTNIRDKTDSINEPVTTPHLNIRTTPRPSGGIQMQEVIERDTSPDFVLHDKFYTHNAELQINASSTDPLNLLKPLNIIGGGVVKGDFYATEENGWGRLLETIEPDG